MTIPLIPLTSCPVQYDSTLFDTAVEECVQTDLSRANIATWHLKSKKIDEYVGSIKARVEKEFLNTTHPLNPHIFDRLQPPQFTPDQFQSLLDLTAKMIDSSSTPGYFSKNFVGVKCGIVEFVLKKKIVDGMQTSALMRFLTTLLDQKTAIQLLFSQSNQNQTSENARLPIVEDPFNFWRKKFLNAKQAWKIDKDKLAIVSNNLKTCNQKLGDYKAKLTQCNSTQLTMKTPKRLKDEGPDCSYWGWSIGIASVSSFGLGLLVSSVFKLFRQRQIQDQNIGDDFKALNPASSRTIRIQRIPEVEELI